MPRTNATRAARSANDRHTQRDVPEGTRRGNTTYESHRAGRVADNARTDRLMGMADRNQL